MKSKNQHEGKKLEELIERSGLKKVEISQKMSIHKNTLTNWVGKEELKSGILINACKIMGFNPAIEFDRVTNDMISSSSDNRHTVIEELEELQNQYSILSNKLSRLSIKIEILLEENCITS